MFNPSRDQARRFFIDTWSKVRQAALLTPLEHLAAELIAQHPEYQPLLEAPDAEQREFRPEDGQINPFLHLSLHLAIEEQLAINQPPGLREAFAPLLARHGKHHDALHEVLECLAECIWQAQRTHTPLDGAAYVDAVRKRC